MTTIKIIMCEAKGQPNIDNGRSSYYDSFHYYSSDLVRNPSSIEEFVTKFPSNFEPALQKYISSWEATITVNNAIHEENLPKIESMNLEIAEIEEFMVSKGFPSSYKTYNPKSRTKAGRSLTHDAGYKQDIQRLYNRNDGYQEAIRIANNHITQGKEALRLCLAYKTQKEFSDKIKKEKNKKFYELVKLCETLGIASDEILSCNYEEVLCEVKDAILEKSKLLALADAMLSVREYWNDGCDSVTRSLFSPKNDIEKEIMKCVRASIDSFHEGHDGRVFKDMKWSYDKIFSYVAKTEPEIYALYEKVSEQ